MCRGKHLTKAITIYSNLDAVRLLQISTWLDSRPGIAAEVLNKELVLLPSHKAMSNNRIASGP